MSNYREVYVKTAERTRRILPNSAPSDVRVRVKFLDEIDIDLLIPFAGYPFRPYDEKRLHEMVESIKETGVVSPIIVRMNDEKEKFEILSGLNRANAAKKAGLKVISAEVYKNISDDDAKLIVAELNLMQRSFTDMVPSERAYIISILYDAMKKNPGYRSDLYDELEDETCSQVGNRSRTIEKLGKKYDLSKNTIARYLRISKLIKPLQNMLDDDLVSVNAAVELSYLKDDEQKMIAQLQLGSKKISIQKAGQLREASGNGTLTQETAEQILTKTQQKGKSVKLNNNLLTQYFREDQTPEEIEQVIASALELYFRQNS